MRAATVTASLALSGAASLAHAGVIHHAELTNGLTGVVLTDDAVDVAVTASPRAFRAKTVNGVTAVGVEGGNVTGEIDSNEIMAFAFDEPVYITSLAIAHLFTDGQFGDHPAEVALISTDVGSFTIEATHSTSGSWTGAGSLANLSTATNAGAGYWMASTESLKTPGIFGAPVTSLALQSGNPGTHAHYADYGFVQLTFARVPAPATIPALALAAGLASRRRRSGA